MVKLFRLKIIFFSVLLAVIIEISFSSCQQNKQNNIEKHALYYYFQGTDAYRNQNYSVFLMSLQKAVELAPNSPKFMYDLARAYSIKATKRNPFGG